jgi:hypothetical protein
MRYLEIISRSSKFTAIPERDRGLNSVPVYDQSKKEYSSSKKSMHKFKIHYFLN